MEGFSYARGLAFDTQGNLYVVDEYGYRVLKFNLPLSTDTVPDRVIGQPNLETLTSGTFKLPLGVGVDSAGNVYVADVQAKQIYRFNQPAANVTAPDQNYSDYAGPNDFEGPTDVTFDKQGNLYAAYVNARRIGVFADPLADKSGDYVFENVNYPHGMAFDKKGGLYVALCNAVYPCNDPGKLLVFEAPPAPATPTPTTPVQTNIQLSVDITADRKPISPFIYGLHNAPESFAKEISLPVRRMGGNLATRYNWTVEATNSGLDWYFANRPPEMKADDFVARDRRSGTRSILTIPMTGWVAKDDSNGTCGYSVAKYLYTPKTWPAAGLDTAAAPFFPDCGTGITAFAADGGPLYVQGVDPTDTSIAADPAFVANWINHLKSQFASADKGGVTFYSLDNEPDIWWESHADVAPLGYTYQQFRDRSLAYAAAVKQADPAAQLLGPAVSGWTYYFHSFYDGQRRDWATPDDRDANGGTPFLAWYLQQMKAYEDANGARLLDYLDVHFYPQAGQYDSPAGSPADQALRLRSTRALWDPAYVDESWIKDAGPDGGIVQLIPRLQALVAANYPGTQIALTEYSWGAHADLNGALTQAEILGIFGREGLDLATLFDGVYENEAAKFAADRPSAYAFRIYRNYDGKGGQFGDISVHATSSDPDKLSIFAAQASGDNAVTLVMINKTDSTLSAGLSLNGFTPATTQVYRYSAANLQAIVLQPSETLQASSLTTTFPANSITLMRFPAAGQVTATPSPTPTGTRPASTTTPIVTPSPDNHDRLFLPSVDKS